jgi:hypothetical protein
MSDRYKFTFDENSTTVLKMYEVERNKSKLQKITGSTFELETGLNDLGLESVLSVSQTKLKKGYAETSVFTDQDGDGIYTESLEIEVATSAIKAKNLDKHKFEFNELGEVSLDLKLSKGKWKVDRLDDDESLVKVSLNGVDYVLKTEQERNEVEFELFRDDNQDGIWTKVAEGEAGSQYLDPTTGTVELIGLATYLDASASIIG